MTCHLVLPSLEYLPAYSNALHRGWSPETGRPEAATEDLAKIEIDPAAFVASLNDPDARGAPVMMPDGSTVPRLSGFHRWLWDGDFCGVIKFRWQKDTAELPHTCLGHIGFGVVPWKRNLGYATRALGLLLPDAWAQGLPYVELTADPNNIVSQKVTRANGGVLIEQFMKPAAHGGGECLRFRIILKPV